MKIVSNQMSEKTNFDVSPLLIKANLRRNEIVERSEAPKLLINHSLHA